MLATYRFAIQITAVCLLWYASSSAQNIVNKITLQVCVLLLCSKLHERFFLAPVNFYRLDEINFKGRLITKLEKASLILNQGIRVYVLKRKLKNLRFSGVNLC